MKLLTHLFGKLNFIRIIIPGLFLLLIHESAFSQIDDFIDPSVPVIELNDETKFTSLNGRMGSRFSLSYSGHLHGFYTGSLGFDSDEVEEMLMGVEIKGQLYCFRTSRLPLKARYLENQKLRLSMTGMHFTGETPEGIAVKVSVISPFTVSENLADEGNIKIQITPAFYILAEVENNTSGPLSGRMRIGLSRIPFRTSDLTNERSAASGREINQVVFKDFSHPTTFVGLRSVETKTYNFELQVFHGLENRFEIAANHTAETKLIYATYHDEKVITDNKWNMLLRYYYTKFWENLDQVFDYCEQNYSVLIGKSIRFENILKKSNTTPEEKWTLALTFRSELANTFFLLDEKDRPRFYVVEGRFRHMSTVDVAYETELNALFAPWRLKLQLDQWLTYMAMKEVYIGTGMYGDRKVHIIQGLSAAEYGPYLYHDVGDYPNVSETSDYFFGPYMAVEENASFTLLLYWYWKLTGDDQYTAQQLGMLDVLLQSLINRDTNNNGIADVAMGWSTYDVSNTLKLAPENVYLGVKQLCAYVAAAEMMQTLALKPQGASKTDLKDLHDVEDGEGIGYQYEKNYGNVALRNAQANKYLAEAKKIVTALKKASRKYGYVPLSLDESFTGWDQYSVVTGEGLLYMGLSGTQSEIIDELAGTLKSTYTKAFEKSKTNYGISLTSGEPVTWFSKVMVSDYVASRWFGQNNSTAIFTYQWNKNNRFAYNDGAFSEIRSWPGNWYPRGISALGYVLFEKDFTAGDHDDFLNEIK